MLIKIFPLFVPDERNLGGQTEILGQKERHQRALKAAKPIVNSLIEPFRAKDTVQSPKMMNMTRVNRSATRDYGRTGTDKTGGYSFPVMTRKNRKQDCFLRAEHERNMKLLQTKLVKVGLSMQERKKNPYDYIAKPVYLFRYKTQKKLKSLDTLELQTQESGYKLRSSHEISLFKVAKSDPIDEIPSICLDGTSVYDSAFRLPSQTNFKNQNSLKKNDIFSKLEPEEATHPQSMDFPMCYYS